MNPFWRRHPALLIGFFMLFATALALAPHPLYILLCVALFAPCIQKEAPRRLFLCGLIVSACAYAWALRHQPPIVPAPVNTTGVFHVESLVLSASPFTRSYCYKGVLKIDDGCSIPCAIFHPLKKAPRADRDYRMEGTLVQKKRHVFAFKPKKSSAWIPIEKSFSFAQWRYQAKRSVAAYIKRHVPHPESSTFLNALITGEIDEKALSLDFARLGLQHLLAISGLHFSFFAWICNLLLRPLCGLRVRIALLILALSSYFFFLGSAPSILRAFTALSLFFCAAPLKRRANALNLLGVALIVELLINPLVLTRLSFQLSFLCTLALLLYGPIMHTVCLKLFKERSFHELQAMPLLDKHGYILGSLLRKALSVNLAVHLLSLPVLLHLFHKFPLLSLFYNLFFPFCVFASLLLFCMALLCPPLHALNSLWTHWLLQLTSHPPAYCDFALRCSIPFSATLLILALLFYGGVRFSNQKL